MNDAVAAAIAQPTFGHLPTGLPIVRTMTTRNRLARAAFALNPARHFLLGTEVPELPATTPWADAPPVRIHPRLREYGEVAPRGPLPRVQDRQADRERLEAHLTEEDREIQAARARLANGKPKRLSDLGQLDRHGFQLFLHLLGETLPAQTNPENAVERQTGDGLLHVRLETIRRRLYR